MENDKLEIDASGITLETTDASGNIVSADNVAQLEQATDASGTITGFTIKPIQDFFGRLFLNYGVSDGQDTTATSALLNFSSINDAPDLTNQVRVLNPGTEDITTRLQSPI